MEGFSKIYNNTIGIALAAINRKPVTTQIIFNDTCFELSINQLEIFLQLIIKTKSYKPSSNCNTSKGAKPILLKTPIDGVNVAVSFSELLEIEDLVRGALFMLKINSYIENICDI